MSSTFEKLTSNKVKLNFVVSAEDFDKALATAYSKNVKRFNIPGFRRGKAPRHVIEMHYGPSVFFEDAFDEIFPVVYSEAIKEHSVEPVDRPELDVTQIEKGKDLIFSVEVFVRPDVVLGDYKNLEAKKVVDEVTDDDVSAEVERARDRNSRFVEVTDRPAKLDDQVNIDYAGFDGDNQFAGGTAKGQELVLGSGHFIPGFEEQVAGAAVGEERDVKVTFPTEYVPELAGKDAVFHIKVHQITRRAMPEWDDDFARRQGFADVSALRRAVMETAVQKKQAQAAEQFANDLIRQVTETMTVTIPAAMVENQLDGLINELRGHLQAQGVSLEQYLEMGNTTMEQLRDHAREQAAAAARYELAMTEIARREGIDISEADVDAKYAEDMYLLTGDNYGMGYEGGRYIAEKLEGKGKVIALCKPAAGNVNEDRMQGFKDYLEANCPDIELIAEIASDFTREAGLHDMNSALTAYSEIDAVFSLDDETSIGALQAIVESGRTDVKAITGGGGCQEYFKIIKGNESINICSALYSPLMVREAVDMAVSVLKGEKVDPVLVIPTTIVDRSNVDEYLDPNNTVY